MNFVLIPRFAEMSGYTKKAIEQKIFKRVWLQGVHYVRAPDGRIFINVERVEKWAKG